MMRWKLRSASTGASCQSVSSMPQYSFTPPRAEHEPDGLLPVGDVVHADRLVRADRVGGRGRLDHVRHHQRERHLALRVVDDPFRGRAVVEHARRLVLDHRLRSRRRDRVVVRLADDDAQHRPAAADRYERARQRRRVRRSHDRSKRAGGRLRALAPRLVVDLRVEVVERGRVAAWPGRRSSMLIAALTEPGLGVAGRARDAVPVQDDDRRLRRLGDALLDVSAEGDGVRVLLLA